MQHELNWMNLKASTSHIEFLESYLGPQLLPKFARRLDLETMPTGVLGVYRAVAELMADLIPEADQVVRADFDTNTSAIPGAINGYLAMYIGVQTPAFETRRQFISLAYSPTHTELPWRFYIAGAQEEGNLHSLIHESEATRSINGLCIGEIDDLMNALPKLTAVAEYYRGSIAARKRGVVGFVPSTAYERQRYINEHVHGANADQRLMHAKEIAFNYFKNTAAGMPIAEVNSFKSRVKTTQGKQVWEKFVYMVYSGYAPEAAFPNIREAMKSI